MLAAELPLGILEAQGRSLSPLARSGIVQNVDGLLNHAEACNRRLVGIYYGRAVLAQFGFDNHADRDGDARAWLKQALTVDPSHYASRMRLADLQMKAGDDAGALATLRQGMHIVPHNDPSHFYAMAADVAHKQGDTGLEGEARKKLNAWQAAHVAAPLESVAAAAPQL